MRGRERSSPETRLRRWQYVTAATLLVGYTGYYLCRSNLSVAAPTLAGLALVLRMTLKASPAVVGLPEQDVHPLNVYRAAGTDSTPAGVCLATVVVVWLYTRDHATAAAVPERVSI